MLHHVSLGVRDLARSSAFYDAVLQPLGYVRVWSDPTAVGYGMSGGGDTLALKLRPDGSITLGSGFHLALAAPSQEAVALFYQAALASGGQDNGQPGLRPNYGPNYFAAFVIDPDGHHIEAVINSRT
jgi:catechol 2,3-dioxygenase-like lactoylglutathione lyase family enzyme